MIKIKASVTMFHNLEDVIQWAVLLNGDLEAVRQVEEMV